MKKTVALAAFLTILGATTSCTTTSPLVGANNHTQSSGNAVGLGGLLGGGDLGTTLGNVLEGVFSSSNITVADMQGEWTSAGPAVCFQSQDLLKKAGGIAAASAIETKLTPYYNQYGLNDAKLTVNADGTFTLNLKQIRLSGTISKKAGAQQGVFDFNFTVLGQKLASVPTYVEKSYGSMSVMFDATKLQKLLSGISQFVGNSMVTSITDVINSYDGLCVGFKFRGGKTQSGSNSGFGLGDILNGLGGSGSSPLKK